MGVALGGRPVVHAELHALEPAWQQLADTCATLPTQAPDWTLAAAVLPRSRPLVVEAVHRDGELVALATLSSCGHQLAVLGAGLLFEPGDLLAVDDAARDELCRLLLARGRPVVLRHLPVTSGTPAALARTLGRGGRLVTRPEPGSPYLDLDARWEELGGGLSSRRRSDLRRALRRAEGLGAVEVRMLRPRPEELAAVLQEALAVEATGWKGAAGTALVCDPLRAPFYRRYAARLAARGELLVTFLDVGGRPAAMQLAAVWRNRVWLLKIGYDPAYRQCSPGVLLLAHLVQQAAREQRSGIEFLGVAEEWLAPWSTGVRERVNVVAVPAHVRALPGVVTLAAPLVRGVVTRAGADVVQGLGERLRGRYVTGPTLADARLVEGAHAARGRATLLGYWHRAEDTTSEVRDQYAACLDALAGRADAQVSVKLSGLGGDVAALRGLLDRARAAGVGLHVDAMSHDDQDAALAAVRTLAAEADGHLGCTLPGRWGRSLDDAATMGRLPVKIRVVKGEWAASPGPDQDPRRGYLDVVAALCASAPRQVQVATHDAALLDESLGLLTRAGVPCEHQVLWGMNARPAVRVALRHGVTTRIFVPYGAGRVPFPLREVARRPDYALRLVRDLTRRPRVY